MAFCLTQPTNNFQTAHTNPKSAAKTQGVPHAQTAKHALHHHPRQLSA